MHESRRVRLTRYFRAHPEMLMLLIAVPLFLVGLSTVFVNQFRPVSEVTPLPASTGTEAITPKESRPKESQIGPTSAQPLAAYVPKRKELLKAKASKQPRQASFAVVSFDSYRKISEVEAFLRSSRLDLVAVQMRIPLPTFDAQSVAVRQRLVTQVVAETNGQAKIDELKEELIELEKIIPTVTDPQYRAVYEADADARRSAIGLLRSDPSLIFALVVKASNANLAKAAAMAGIRLVDVADTADITVESHDFFGLLPEDSVNASWP